MEYAKSPRNTVKRIPKRGFYDQETVFSILDDGFLCHLGFVIGDQPYVIPTSYGRMGTRLYVHGASTSRMLLATAEGIPVCLTVTHLDALVLARSAFHHSMNYRSAVIFGVARLVDDETEKMEALYCISEHILKGRWDEVRGPNTIEMKATSVLRIDIEEASAKIRTGPPGDDAEDYQLPVWAGILPLKKGYDPAIPDPRLEEGIEKSPSISA
ncbi:MAG: pyridoxamine 5'-phosphate oxidase family protein [Bacteroidetes bacterium]|nr:pyridoxamine 5'-phosphate oxidase family protein [Bacteroidota bacterium]